MNKDDLRWMYHALLAQDTSLQSRIQGLRSQLEFLEDRARDLDTRIERVYADLMSKEDS